MLINKITAGFVIQTFDTENKVYIKQEFFADDKAPDYEDKYGNEVSWQQMKEANFGPLADEEPILNFDMVQPIHAEFRKDS